MGACKCNRAAQQLQSMLNNYAGNRKLLYEKSLLHIYLSVQEQEETKRDPRHIFITKTSLEVLF